ncbi:hypothetical protein QOZ88_06345 [Blastococcus sp. BMG 814]|uniref:Uncharacterized protein n=1 Tax=Blastococcus carthaginiensis TaxID=3050034 RepID=A0ABT9I9K3_9ACTN|nr:hypothetical protein [Blastococcus carthaginiensis]MDP5182251.1 hypothetical protein [Blastococcus carthaginiensis]
MALPENVAAVLAAIKAVYSTATSEPHQGDIVAASGLSRSTYHRVLRDHPEAGEALDLAHAVFMRASGVIEPREDPDEGDPVKRNPMAAINELLITIARLTDIVEAQKRRIQALEDERTLRRLNL